MHVVLHVRRLLGELGFPQSKKTVILSNNQNCIAIAKKPVFHARTKHIEIQYHFVREKVLDETISLEYYSTSNNATDIFTKPLPQQMLLTHSNSLGLGTQPGAERGC